MCWEWRLRITYKQLVLQSPDVGCWGPSLSPFLRPSHVLDQELPARETALCPSESSGILRTGPPGLVDAGIWESLCPKTRDWLLAALPLSKTRTIKQWGWGP